MHVDCLCELDDTNAVSHIVGSLVLSVESSVLTLHNTYIIGADIPSRRYCRNNQSEGVPGRVLAWDSRWKHWNRPRGGGAAPAKGGARGGKTLKVLVPDLENPKTQQFALSSRCANNHAKWLWLVVQGRST